MEDKITWELGREILKKMLGLEHHIKDLEQKTQCKHHPYKVDSGNIHCTKCRAVYPCYGGSMVRSTPIIPKKDYKRIGEYMNQYLQMHLDDARREFDMIQVIVVSKTLLGRIHVIRYSVEKADDPREDCDYNLMFTPHTATNAGEDSTVILGGVSGDADVRVHNYDKGDLL